MTPSTITFLSAFANLVVIFLLLVSLLYVARSLVYLVRKPPKKWNRLTKRTTFLFTITLVSWILVNLLGQFFGVELGCFSSGSAMPPEGILRLGFNDHYYGYTKDFKEIENIRESGKDIFIDTNLYTTEAKLDKNGSSTKLEFDFYNSGEENVTLMLKGLYHLQNGTYFNMDGYGSVCSRCSCKVNNMPLTLSSNNHIFLKRDITMDEGTDDYVGLEEGEYRLLFLLPKYFDWEYKATPYYYDFEIDYSKANIIQEKTTQ